MYNKNHISVCHSSLTRIKSIFSSEKKIVFLVATSPSPGPTEKWFSFKMEAFESAIKEWTTAKLDDLKKQLDESKSKESLWALQNDDRSGSRMGWISIQDLSKAKNNLLKATGLSHSEKSYVNFHYKLDTYFEKAEDYAKFSTNLINLLSVLRNDLPLLATKPLPSNIAQEAPTSREVIWEDDYASKIINEDWKIDQSKLTRQINIFKNWPLASSFPTSSIDKLNKKFIEKYFYNESGTLNKDLFNEFIQIAIDKDKHKKYVWDLEEYDLETIAKEFLNQKRNDIIDKADDKYKSDHPVISSLCDAFPQFKWIIIALASIFWNWIDYWDAKRLEKVIWLDKKLRIWEKVASFDKFLALQKEDSQTLIDWNFDKFEKKEKFQNLLVELTWYRKDSNREVIKQFATESDKDDFSFTVKTNLSTDAEKILRQVSNKSENMLDLSDFLRSVSNDNFDPDEFLSTKWLNINKWKVIIWSIDGSTLTFKEVEWEEALSKALSKAYYEISWRTLNQSATTN